MLSYFQETGKIHVTLETKKNGFRRFLLPDVSHATQELLNSQAALLESGATSYFRVSIQGVKSLYGDCIVFPRLGTGDTDRWRINKGRLSVYPVPNLRKMMRSPHSDLTPWILTLAMGFQIVAIM